MSTKLVIELSVKDMAAGALKNLNFQLNGTAVKAKQAFVSANVESKRFGGTLGALNSQLLRFSAAYLSIRGMGRLFSLARQNSEELDASMGNLSKQTGKWFGSLINFFEGDKLINAVAGMFGKLNSEFEKFRPGVGISEILSGSAPLTDKAFVDDVLGRLKKIAEAKVAWGIYSNDATMDAYNKEEARLRAALKVFVDAENSKIKASANRIDAIEARERMLDEWKKRRSEIKSNEEREAVRNPQLGIADRSLSGNIFAPGHAVAVGMIESQAEAGAKAYEKLTEAQNNWYNKSSENLRKAQQEFEQMAEHQSQIAAMFGDNIGRAISEGFGKGAEGWSIAMKGVLVEGMEFLRAVALQAIATSTAKELALVPFPLWPAILAAGAGKAAVVSTLIGAAEYGVNSFGSKKYASGTSSASGGMSLVGEHGPELMNVPRGSQVFNHRDTTNMMNGDTYNVYLPAGASRQNVRDVTDEMEKLQRDGRLNRFMVRTLQYAGNK